MTLYCAIDLRSNIKVPVVIDDQDNTFYQKRRPNNIEEAVILQTTASTTFQKLYTIIGVGQIFGQTIMLETRDIQHFKNVGNLASYSPFFTSKNKRHSAFLSTK